MAIRSLATKGLLLGILLSPLSAVAATESLLQQFEKDATTPRDSGDSYRQPARNKHKRREESGDSESSYTGDLGHDLAQDLVQDLASSITDLFFQMVSTPGIYSWQRVAPPIADPEEARATPRREGEGLIPFARVDVSYNRVNSRISAISGRGEVGFGPFGFEARTAHYSEKDPSASLDILQYHFLYRMSLGDQVEMDVGLGEYQLSGVATNTGSSFTLHMHIYPSDHLGIELRPSWATINGNSIRDHEMAVSYGEIYWAARAGYHWLEGPSTRLNGPFVGFSVRF